MGEIFSGNDYVIAYKQKFSEYKVWAYPLNIVANKSFPFYFVTFVQI